MVALEVLVAVLMVIVVVVKSENASNGGDVI